MFSKAPLALLLALIAPFGASSGLAATIPFLENFDALPIGDAAVPNFTETITPAQPLFGGPQSVVANYTVVSGSMAGDNNYRADVSVGQNNVTASAAVQLAGLTSTSFSISTDFNVVSRTRGPGTQLRLGLGLFGDNPDFSTGSRYQIGFTVDTNSITGEIGTLYIEENGTRSAFPGTSIGLVVGVNCSLLVSGTYVGSALTLTATATRLDTGAQSTVSITDPTAQTGQFFGLFSNVSVSSHDSMVVDFDNFRVVPEPSSPALVCAGAGLLAGTGWRRRRAFSHMGGR